MVVSGDLGSDEPAEGRLAGFRGVMADGRLVDLTGDYEQERLVRRCECCFDARCVEEAEGSVQRFAEGPVVVVVDSPQCRTTRTRSSCCPSPESANRAL